jgi:hypothetical protein
MSQTIDRQLILALNTDVILNISQITVLFDSFILTTMDLLSNIQLDFKPTHEYLIDYFRHEVRIVLLSKPARL